MFCLLNSDDAEHWSSRIQLRSDIYPEPILGCRCVRLCASEVWVWVTIKTKILLIINNISLQTLKSTIIYGIPRVQNLSSLLPKWDSSLVPILPIYVDVFNSLALSFMCCKDVKVLKSCSYIIAIIDFVLPKTASSSPINGY